MHHPVAHHLAVAAAMAAAGDHQDLIRPAVGGEEAIEAQEQPHTATERQRDQQGKVEGRHPADLKGGPGPGRTGSAAHAGEQRRRRR